MGLAKTALAAGTLLVAAPTAHAGMTTPRVVSPTGLSVQESAVGAGGGRTAILMSGLRGRQGAVYARLGGVTSLGASTRLSRRRGSMPTVAVGADGTVVAAWVEGSSDARVAIAPPGQPFGAVRTLRPDSTGGTPDRPFRIGGIAIAPSGRAVIAWRTGGTVQASVAAPLGRFGTAVRIGVARQHDPSIALGLGGTAVIAWLDTPNPPLPPPNTVNPGPAHVRAATLSEGTTTFSTPTELGAVAYWPAGASTGSGPGGALVSWWQDGAVRVSGLGLTGGFSAPINPPVTSAGDRTALATDASASTIAVWRAATYAGGDDLETVTAATTLASVAPAGGAFGTAQALSTAGRIPNEPVVAAMPDRTFAVWEERAAGRKARIQAAIRRPHGSWTRLGGLMVTAPQGQAGMAVHASADAHHAPVTWITSPRTNSDGFGGTLSLSTYRP